jgi:hypothetical protein
LIGLVAWLGLGGIAAAEEAVTATEGAAAEPTTMSASANTGRDEGNRGVPQEENDAAHAPAKNALYLEGLGAGFLYSINYERLVTDAVAVRLGFSYLSVSASATSGGMTETASASLVTVPITVSYVGVRHLELGGGMSILHASGSASGVGVNASGSGFLPLGTAMVGYRLHPEGGPGFQFRVGGMGMMGKGLSLGASDPGGFGIIPWLYLSAGAGF